MSRRRRQRWQPSVKVPRHFSPGVRIDTRYGSKLNVAVLAGQEDELFGVDLASGAYVRIDLRDNDLPAEEVAGVDQARNERIQRTPSPHLVTIRIGNRESTDPGRPEAIWPEGPPRPGGPLSARQIRRLLKSVKAEEQPRGLILSSRAPSVAYIDLLPGTPSMMVISLHPKKTMLMADGHGEVRLTFVWSGITQSLTVRDPRAGAAARAHSNRELEGEALTRALGFPARYALITYGRVADGYVRKVVTSILAG